MKAAFLDTSVMAAILFEEPGSPELFGIVSGLESLYASDLLEAEIRSAAAREGIDPQAVDRALLKLKWIHPDRSLTQELKQAVSTGIFLRGADLWHLACALYLAGDPSSMPFVTLDGAQAQAAARLGFQVLPEHPETENSARETGAAYGAKKTKAKAGKRKMKF